MTAKTPYIFCAVDTPDLQTAEEICAVIAQTECGVKLGLEFFNAQGPQGVQKIRDAYPDLPLFLDLKYHDIPNTVAGAVRTVVPLRPHYINVHAGGGADMMCAAKEAACEEAVRRGIEPPKVLAVTLLTSLDEQALDDIGYRQGLQDRVKQLALLTKKAGLDGVVCSALEIELLREACGPDFILMVPGIRPPSSDQGDQKRIATPEDAIRSGATHLVIGRPVTKADHPIQTAKNIIESIKSITS